LVLETNKRKLLDIREGKWGIKSRAVWFDKLYKNTIFFHQYANHIKRVIIIWEIQAREYKSVKNFKENVDIKVYHF
jgi:hypothetical protein